MRVFKELEDIEFNKKNSIYDSTSSLTNEFIILELNLTIIKNGVYYKSRLNSKSPIFKKQYPILKKYDSKYYHPSTGYIPRLDDVIGMTKNIRLGVVDGVECILIKLQDNIHLQVDDDEEYDFTILGTSNMGKGNLLNGGILDNNIKTIEYIIFNKRKKNEETDI